MTRYDCYFFIYVGTILMDYTFYFEVYTLIDQQYEVNWKLSYD